MDDPDPQPLTIEERRFLDSTASLTDAEAFLGVRLGAPTSPQTDPSKVVGVVTGRPQPPAPRSDDELIEELRDAVQRDAAGSSSGELDSAVTAELLAFVERCSAALKRVAATEEHGYDPITDTGAPR